MSQHRDLMIPIYFMLNGQKYAFRAWPQVPRIGEVVCLGKPAVGYCVTMVSWMDDPDHAVGADVHIEPIAEEADDA